MQVLGQVVSQRELLARRGEWKRTGEGVVCAYGAFDLLHPGHVRLLEQARDLADILVVAVESDGLVRAAAESSDQSAPGEGAQEIDRPITPAAERAEILAALSAVDFAAMVEWPLAQFLQIFRPDIFVRGDEPAESSAPDSGHGELGSVLAEIKCELVRLPLEPGYSTRRLIERISSGRA